MLETDLQPDISVHGNQLQLRQVVEILLDNAQKYSSTGTVRMRLRKQGRKCLLSVSNPGDPIPKEELRRIFQRFYRSDKARTRTGSFGLGLSIAQSIMVAHRGRIWAVSNETGNCFYVELPCE